MNSKSLSNFFSIEYLINLIGINICLYNMNCYKSVQSFRVTCLFTGQYNTKGYGTITDVI